MTCAAAAAEDLKNLPWLRTISLFIHIYPAASNAGVLANNPAIKEVKDGVRAPHGHDIMGSRSSATDNFFGDNPDIILLLRARLLLKTFEAHDWPRRHHHQRIRWSNERNCSIELLDPEHSGI